MELHLVEVPKDWGQGRFACESKNIVAGQEYLYRKGGSWFAGRALRTWYGWNIGGWMGVPVQLDGIDAVYELPPCPEKRSYLDEEEDPDGAD